MFNSRNKNVAKQYLRNTSGNVALIAAVSVIPLVTIAGFAVDFQRVLTSKNTVQHTLDAAIIAAARERQAGRSENQIRAFVSSQFDTLLNANTSDVGCSDPVVVFDPESEEIDASVNCSQPTTLAAAFGRESLDFSVSTASTYGIGQVDVAFVFDLSGSMNNSGRLPALKAAANDAITTLLPDDSPLTDEVRLAISTYNHSVNAGRFFDAVTEEVRRPSQIEISEDVGDDYVDDYVGRVQIDARNNRRFFDFETVYCREGSDSNCTDFTDYGARQYFESTCVYNRTGEEAYSDAPPNNDQYIFAGHPLWDFADNEDEDNEPQQFTDKADGEREIMQRRGDYRSSEFYDRNGNVRTSSLSGTSSSRGSYTRSIRFGNSINDDFPIEGCRPENEPVPLTSDADELRDFIEDMEAGGGTAGHLGIAWGWYLLSPHWDGVWPNGSEPLAYNEPDTAKALIIMTDGEFNATFPRNYDPDGIPQNSDTSTEIAARYCENIKQATNITIFTVGFSVPNNASKVKDSGGQTIVQYCASSPDFVFEADNAQELRDAYNQIAAEISDLRLSR
ncbi:MAG: pilus assembly protein TadG-related protein [Pseudomonadota bacterium]